MLRNQSRQRIRIGNGGKKETPENMESVWRQLRSETNVNPHETRPAAERKPMLWNQWHQRVWNGNSGKKEILENMEPA